MLRVRIIIMQPKWCGRGICVNPMIHRSHARDYSVALFTLRGEARLWWERISSSHLFRDNRESMIANTLSAVKNHLDYTVERIVKTRSAQYEREREKGEKGEKEARSGGNFRAPYSLARRKRVAGVALLRAAREESLWLIRLIIPTLARQIFQVVRALWSNVDVALRRTQTSFGISVRVARPDHSGD